MAITVGVALASEYPAILRSLPQDWLQPAPHLLQLQVARMVDAGRFLVARTDTGRIVGTIGWDDHVAFGGMYAKFVSVLPPYRSQGVALLLGRELVHTARRLGHRAVFGDIPSDSPLVPFARSLPAIDEAGYIDDLHGPGIRSLIFRLDLAKAPLLLSALDERIKGARASGLTSNPF
jgi:GNAT superfamily N-acetyltransferase